MSAAGMIPSDVRTIVVICPSWVGDTVMATPVYAALREHRPDAEIVGLMRPGLDAVLDGGGWFDAMHIAPNRGLAGPVKTARLMRGLKAEAALLLPNSFRWAATVRLAGVKRRVGYDRDGRGWLLTGRVKVPDWPRPYATAAYYRHLAAASLGVERVDGPISLTVTPRQEAAAEALLEDVQGRFVLLNPGGNKEAKRWPAERFAAVAAALRERFGLDAAVTGSPGEAALLQRVVAAGRELGARIVNLGERGVSLGSLKGVVARAAVLITNDTGPRHLAVALGTPVVTLFGPTDHRWTTVDCPRERLLLAEPFLPAELVADDHPRGCVVERITVGDVVHAAAAIITGPGGTQTDPLETADERI